eukprot:2374285-Amphidinium_carterae.2
MSIMTSQSQRLHRLTSTEPQLRHSLNNACSPAHTSVILALCRRPAHQQTHDQDRWLFVCSNPGAKFATSYRSTMDFARPTSHQQYLRQADTIIKDACPRMETPRLYERNGFLTEIHT